MTLPWTVENAVPSHIREKIEKIDSKSPALYFIAFLDIISELKKCERTGWISKIEKPESVADHMYRMSIICMFCNPSLNSARCSQISLCHDMAEAIVGDITPCDPNVDKDEKHRRELAAIEYMRDLVAKFNPAAGRMIYELWCEYEYQTTDEAKFVKQVDKFELLLQTTEYMEMHPDSTDSIKEMLGSKKYLDGEVLQWSDALDVYRNLRNSNK